MKAIDHRNLTYASIDVASGHHPVIPALRSRSTPADHIARDGGTDSVATGLPQSFSHGPSFSHALYDRTGKLPGSSAAVAGEVTHSDVIARYRQFLAEAPLDFSLISSEKIEDITILRYKMTSQHWSPGEAVQPPAWVHDVDMFVPDNALSRVGLLVANNGINQLCGAEGPSAATDFSETTLIDIAKATRTAVVSISDIPNQYLVFADDPRKLREDDSVARSWTLFMDQQPGNALLPLHIPMAAALSQAIRLGKEALAASEIDKFVVTGISKRALAAWLLPTFTTDIAAIVPFAYDALNTRRVLEHIYDTYGRNWPIAHHAYYGLGVDQRINTPAFAELMQVIDPLGHMHDPRHAYASLPKYVINASGDDFFVPDNTRFYYDALAGEKSLRAVPNSSHFGIKAFTEQSLVTFMNRFQTGCRLPALSATLYDHALTINLSEQAKTLTLWTAHNAVSRDFRQACNVSFVPKTLDPEIAGPITIPLDDGTEGWKAMFLEASFADGFIATSQVYIVPVDRYPQEPPASHGRFCKSLPGRGLDGTH